MMEVAQQMPTDSGYGWIFWVVFAVILVICWFVFIYPNWRIWASHKAGQADFQFAQNEQKIQISKAQARLDAAALNKQAAIIEAEAVAKQIETIGANLKEHDLYLKWQWIKMMEERPDSSVIYVPTEASLPILEATRLNSKPNKEEV